MTTMYHYTSEEGHKGITKTKKLRPSLRANNPKDARYGDGQYLSDIRPGDKNPKQLSYIFFGMPFAPHRFTHYISISVKGLEVVSGRNHVYVVRNKRPLDISDRLVADGKVKKGI